MSELLKLDKYLTVQNSARDHYRLHVRTWKDCQDCPLCGIRRQVVFARGELPAHILFIGEAPGESENAIGYPFVGAAGDLLDDMLEAVIPPILTYAITNIVACYPNDETRLRAPTRQEALACRPRLSELIAVCQPKLIVTLGQIAKRYLPPTKLPVCCLIHPAAILRLPGVKTTLEIRRFQTNLHQSVMQHLY